MIRVRERLSGAPWWVLSLVAGTPFGVSMMVFGLTQGESAATAVVTGAVAGVLFGLVMGPTTRRANARRTAALGDVTSAQRRTARRAAWRGPTPADPDVRRAALDLLDHQLMIYRKLRWAIFMYAGFLVLVIWLVVTESHWYALELPIFGGFLLAQLWMPRHLRQRRFLLATEQPSPVGRA